MDIISTGSEMIFDGQSWEKKSYIKIDPKEALGLISIMTETEWKAFCVFVSLCDDTGYCRDAESGLSKILMISKMECRAILKRLQDKRWNDSPILTAIKIDGRTDYSICGIPKAKNEPNNRDLIAELTNMLFQVPGIEQKKGHYKIVGKAHMRYGYDCVYQAIADLEFEILGQKAAGLPEIPQSDIPKMLFARCEWNKKRTQKKENKENKSLSVNDLLGHGFKVEGNTLLPPQEGVEQ